MSFLYFIPREMKEFAGEIDNKELSKIDPALGVMFKDVKLDSRSIKDNGPDGGAGKLFGLAHGVDRKFKADEQTWRKAPAGYWVGYWNDNAPNAQTLNRPTRYGGFSVELGNGESWIIPILRVAVTGESALPSAMVILDSGELGFEPLKKYAGANKFATRFWQQICADNDIAQDGNEAGADDQKTEVGTFDRMEVQDLFDFAIVGMQLNYYVSAIEVSILQLFTGSPDKDNAAGNIWDICKCLIDFPTILAVMAQQELDKAGKEQADADIQDGSPIVDGSAAT